MHFVLSVLLLTAVLLPLVVKVTSESTKHEKHRLPKDVIPTHYDIHVEIGSLTGVNMFAGSVKIHVDVMRPTTKIVLHSAVDKLKIKSVNLLDSELRWLMAPKVDLPKRTDQFPKLLISWHKMLGIGSYIMQIEFAVEGYSEGTLVRSYSDSDGSTKYYMLTQFEPTYARYAFPCFDEPALKATFDLEIIHHKNYTVDSNMPLEGAPHALINNQDMVLSRFQRTPLMSTYSLAWTLSQFNSFDSTNHTTIARAAVLNETTYSLQIAKQLLRALDEHTAIPYSSYMPKLDHQEVPIPRNWWKAKENWGLIVYAEYSLLYDPVIHDAQEQATTLKTIAHELAHMWFGNLVTPEWWDYLWMKEGFATLYMYYALQLARPSEQWMDWFTIEIIPKGRESKTWFPDTITKECRSEESIRNNYRTAIFERAGSVLNMFRQVIGNERWQLMVRNFLQKHQLGSVVPDDLYGEIAAVVEGTDIFPRNRTVQQTIDSWMTIPYTPMLLVQRSYNEGKIEIWQSQLHHFDGNPTKWILPFDYATESLPDFEYVGPVQWITESYTSVDTSAPANEWIVVNKRQFATYRINYDERNWKMIVQALRTNVSSIHRLNRAQLLGDAFYFYSRDHLKESILFDLVTFLENETESLVWHVAEPIIKHIERNTRGNKYRGYFKTFLKYLTERYFDHVSSNPITSVQARAVRSAISTLACRAGNERCLDSAEAALIDAFHANDTSRVAPDDVSFVYCFGLRRNATDAAFRWVLDQLMTPDANVRQLRRLFKALGCTTDRDRWRDVLQIVTDPYWLHLSEDEHSSLWSNFGNGLVSDLEEQQFWRLAALMNDTDVLPGVSSRLCSVMFDAMNTRMQSEAASKVLRELGNIFRTKLSISYRMEKYNQAWESRDNFLNKYLEDFVTQRQQLDEVANSAVAQMIQE